MKDHHRSEEDDDQDDRSEQSETRPQRDNVADAHNEEASGSDLTRRKEGGGRGRLVVVSQSNDLQTKLSNRWRNETNLDLFRRLRDKDAATLDVGNPDGNVKHNAREPSASCEAEVEEQAIHPRVLDKDAEEIGVIDDRNHCRNP